MTPLMSPLAARKATMMKNLGPDVSRTSLMESANSRGNRRKSFLARRFCQRSIHCFFSSGGRCDITAAQNQWKAFPADSHHTALRVNCRNSGFAVDEQRRLGEKRARVIGTYLAAPITERS